MRIWKWLTQGRDARDTGEWDFEGDSLRRDLLGDANDGIISSAAIIQGLLSGGATTREALVGVIAIVVIGVVGTFAFQYNEAEGERANVLAIYETERRRVEMDPEEEFLELVAIYERKGLSPKLSIEVARELTQKDALKAQLDAEFSIDEIPTKRWPWMRATYSGLAFLFGSVIPLTFLVLLPFSSRGEITLIAVIAALAVSGWVGHYSEHTGAWRAILRTVAVGLITLGISTLAGSVVTF